MFLSVSRVAAALSAIAICLPLAATAQQGQDVETFTCESKNNQHNECNYRARGEVTVHVNQQLSHTRCVFNDNWGTFDGGVWVDNGCRAEFVVRRPPESRPYRPVGGTLDTITCESKGNGYTHCPVDGIDPSSVHVERQLSRSSCSQGSSWGVSEGETSPPGIWVDRGCRATFAYRTRGGGSFSSYAGTPHDFELPCESINGAWNHCHVDQVHLARVEFIAGTDACRAYKAWGVDDTGIWVRDNCQGAFRITYRH
jgi:hypothetical protein